MRFLLRRSRAGWRFNVVAKNGEIILTSEVYARRASAIRTIALLADSGLKVELEDTTKPKAPRG